MYILKYHIKTSTHSFSNVSVITTHIDVNVYAIKKCFKIMSS